VTQIVAASLWIDSRCALGEEIIWSERRTSSRQEMSQEELEHSPHSAGVGRVIPGATGIPDRTFNDS
jgi:hypothetical protein